MPTYSYQGVKRNGEQASGTIIKNTAEEAKRELQQQGVFITRLDTSAESEQGTAPVAPRSFLGLGFTRSRVPSEKIVDFLRQLATLVEAKLPLVRALTALIEQEDDKVFHGILEKVREQVQGGSTLADALALHPRIFTRLAINMVRAGETGGVLEHALNRLADFSEEEQDMRATVRSAMVYPIILSTVMGLAITLLMTFAVPKFQMVYKSMGTKLPALTEGLISVSKAFTGYWWLMLAAVVTLVVAFKGWQQTAQARVLMDRLKVRLPLLGTLTRKLAIARFSRTFGTLVDGGIPILLALNIAKDTANNVVIEDALDAVSKNVKEGERIAKPLRASGVFPPVVIHMISVGEESGRLGPMLYRIAENYDKQTRTAIKTLTTLLEPLIIVLLAGVVVTVILAMLLPMLDISGMQL